MELATRGSRMKKGDYNLPLDAIAQDLAARMERAGLIASFVEKPEPYGWGGAFRKDRWFATMPVYQHPGTSDLAPTPGVMLERKPRKAPPPRDPGALLKPTRDWPQESQYPSSGFCRGKEECQPPPGRIMNFRGCSKFWREYSEDIFQAFMNANPTVMFRRNRPLKSVMEIDPKYRCQKWDHFSSSQHPMDHTDLCRLPDGRRFIISQPYCTYPECPLCAESIAERQTEIPNLTCIRAGTERSWYYPASSNLMVIGTPDVLETLILDYPAPTGRIPLGCVDYREQIAEVAETTATPTIVAVPAIPVVATA